MQHKTKNQVHQNEDIHSNSDLHRCVKDTFVERGKGSLYMLQFMVISSLNKLLLIMYEHVFKK